MQPLLVNRLIGMAFEALLDWWEGPCEPWISKLDFDVKQGKVCSALCSLVFIEQLGAQ